MERLEVDDLELEVVGVGDGDGAGGGVDFGAVVTVVVLPLPESCPDTVVLPSELRIIAMHRIIRPFIKRLRVREIKRLVGVGMPGLRTF